MRSDSVVEKEAKKTHTIDADRWGLKAPTTTTSSGR